MTDMDGDFERQPLRGCDWTAEDDAMAVDLLHKGKTRQEIALAMGRTRSSVAGRLSRLFAGREAQLRAIAKRPEPQSDYTPEQDAEIMAMLERGMSGNQIAAAIGRSRSSVQNRIHRIRGRQEKIAAGIQVADRVKKWTDDRLIELIRLYNGGMPVRKIAEHFGLTKSRITDRITIIRKADRPDLPKLSARRDGYERQLERVVTPDPVQAVEYRRIAAEMAGRPFESLDRNSCRYAVNSADRHQEHLFCASPSIPGKSWCQHHYGIVYNVRAA